MIFNTFFSLAVRLLAVSVLFVIGAGVLRAEPVAGQSTQDPHVEASQTIGQTEARGFHANNKKDDSASDLGGSSEPPNPVPERKLTINFQRHGHDQVLIQNFVSLDAADLPPMAMSEMLATQDGLALNGQPGIFQTVSIRGLGRQRVLSFVNGMRITSERRAGTAASFIDPLLLSGVEVTQGPASTYYGSGALGGTLHLTTRWSDTPWMHAGWQSDGNETFLASGLGRENYHLGLAVRDRGNGKTASNGFIASEEKNNHFTQGALVYQRQMDWQDYSLTWDVILSDGSNLGKDNARFPSRRITSYPSEKHQLSQVTLSANSDWNTRAYVHHQSLVTEDIRPATRVNQVDTESLDFGFSFDQRWHCSGFDGLFGVDYFGRRGVESLETETSLSSSHQTEYRALGNGKENEAAWFATVNRNFSEWSLHLGARLNHQSQDAEASERVSDSSATYFFSLKKPWSKSVVDLTFGTGFRFASLSERLFNGTTARGTTLGNSRLSPEESQSVDWGYQFRDQGFEFEFHRFFTEIDQLIERVEISDDVLSFQNQPQGKISGWHYASRYSFSDYQLHLNGQKMSGHGHNGEALADIPVDRHRLTLIYEKNAWLAKLEIAHFSAKKQVGPGEMAIDSADRVNFKLAYGFDRHWSASFNLNNLTDQVYYQSFDDLATLASGREIAVALSYR